MSDAVRSTPSSASLRPWRTPVLTELPKLNALTLVSPIGGGGGTGGGGSTVFSFLLALGLGFGLAACAGDQTSPDVGSGGLPNSTAQMLRCRADLEQRTLACDAPAAAPGQGILGNQGVNIGLRSSNVSYNGGTGILSADVTVQNLAGGPIGTLDGTTLSSGVSVFFVSDPTASPTGTVTVNNPTGTATFTAGGQAYFNYPTVLTQYQISSALTWEFLFAGGATSFTFTVLVAADQPEPGAIMHWTSVPGFGDLKYYGIQGWGADGLALLGNNGEHATYEGGVWRTYHDPLEDMQVISTSGNAASWALGTDDFAAFGYSGSSGGYVLRAWDGTGFRTMPGAPGNSAYGIFSSGGQRFAYGFSMWRYTDAGWVADTVPSLTASIASVAKLADGSIATFGGNSAAWIYDPATSDYTRIGTGVSGQTTGGVAFGFGVDSTHLWAASGYSGEPTLRYYDGTGWGSHTLPFNPVDGIYPAAGLALSDTSAFLVSNGGSTAYIFHWDGSSWTTELTIGSAIWGIWARNSSEIYFVRQDGGVNLRDNMGNWSDFLRGGSGHTFAVHLYSGSGGYVGSANGTLFHWNGSSLDSLGVLSNVQPPSIWSTDASHAWVANYSNTIDYWNGTFMDAQDAGTPVRALHGTSESDIWGVGSTGGISHYDGDDWTIAAAAGSVTSQTLWGVYAADVNNAWAVGEGGTIVEWNGTSWSTVTSPVGVQLRAIHGSSATNVWAVGANGNAAHWNGTAWSSSSIGDGQGLVGIYVRNVHEAYAAGANGGLYRYNGTSWNQIAVNAYLSSPTWRGISGFGSRAVVVGSRVLMGRN